MKFNFSNLFIIPIIVLGACSEPIEVDMIVHNATIYSLDDEFSKHEAMAIKDGKIIEIGAENQILNKYSARIKKDAKSQFVYPGFIDAHCHFLEYGLEKNGVNMQGLKSFEELVERILEYAKSSEQKWILGRGWDQNLWESKEFPINDTLSMLFPDHFIALKRIDGHAYFVSKNVIELANVNSETQIQGGKIVVKNESLTGVFIDEAMSFIDSIIPAPEVKTLIDAFQKSQEACFKYGLTTVSDAGLSFEHISMIDSLHHSEFLKMRIYAMLSANNSILNKLTNYRISNDWLDVKSIKLYADGALGSRGAFLLEPYSDDDANYGLLITPSDSIQKWAKACFDADFQLNVHCIGDAANRLVLDIMGKQLKNTNDKRWRIEHAQVISKSDMKKFSEFTIIPSVQPTHATSDMTWAESRLGAVRLETAYSYKSLLNQNGLIALGTDFPVEEISPFNTLYSATERKDKLGNPFEGFLVNEALSRAEALKGITIWAAIANFQDDTRGSLEKGKLADFVILDTDLMNCVPAKILEASVIQTWINGELVYEK